MSFKIACKNCIDLKEFYKDNEISTKRIHVFRCNSCKKIVLIEVFDKNFEHEENFNMYG